MTPLNTIETGGGGDGIEKFWRRFREHSSFSFFFVCYDGAAAAAALGCCCSMRTVRFNGLSVQAAMLDCCENGAGLLSIQSRRQWADEWYELGACRWTEHGKECADRQRRLEKKRKVGKT
ncbi:hypothetical protein Ddc_18397 [Ditylenchus destructor]|nr:hypothetical protein Ddc_18397 [Ditylenchus destructor]